MKKIILAILGLIFILVIGISNTCQFPLSSGTIDSGLQSIQSLQNQLNNTTLNQYPLVAVIVEPRKDNLVNILQHFIDKLPSYTHFQVYHGTNNKDLILENFNEHITSNKISLWNLGVDNLTIQGYSCLLTSKEFWNTIQGEKILIFQTDTITCNKSPFDINEFLEYDFVGAPMNNIIIYGISILFMLKGYLILHQNIYNGGLSIRSKSKMLKVIEKYPWDKLTPEDVWFCCFLPHVGGMLPSKKVASKFSFEADSLENSIPWGLHKPRKEYNKLLNICPEIKKIPFVESHTDYRNLYLL